VAGVTIDFESSAQVQPAIEIGRQFPIDRGARGLLNWGIVTEIFVQF
jgi:hypothetical protein